jgi:GntR family transcriptional repressor for pyruvate dehydrogenase complex
MTGNAVLARMVGELFDGRNAPISSRMAHTETARSWAAALREHELIFQALDARDPQEAAAAMYGHLTASRERWIDGEAVTLPPR